MKVAFWSNCNGRAGTTTNLACLSILFAMLEKKKSVIFENHYNLNGVVQAFTNSKQVEHNILREEFSYYEQTGLEGLIRRVHANHTYKEVLEDIALKYLDNFIYYLPKSRNLNEEYFEYELNQVIRPLLNFLNHAFPYVFIDTAFGQSLSSKTILEQSDLVVVNLCQNKVLLDYFFENYKSLFHKSFILIGNYQEQSQYNLRYIRRRYQVEKERIAVIPHNVLFGDAVNNGTIVEFFTANMSCKRQEENFYFISQVKKAAYLLMKHLEHEEEGIVIQ